MESPRSSSPNVSPLSINVDISQCITPVKNTSNLLLTYSTPVFYPINYIPKCLPISSIKQKPKVNFHSIDDLVGSSPIGSATNNDSGFQSMSSSVTKSSPDTFKQLDFDDEKENHKKIDNGKKFRTTFTEEQKKALDVYFRKNPYPDPKETEELSEQLVLPENVIKVWFQNKRSRDKQRKFSSKSRKNLIQHEETNVSSSPLVANLQLLQSRLNQYAALTAAVQNSQFYSQQYF